MRKYFLLTLMTLSITVMVMAQTPTTDAGIIINGIKWATRNVGAPGTFVDKPEDFGLYYRWNNTEGFSPVDTALIIDFCCRFRTNVSNFVRSWETTNNVCPPGWRTPTMDEFRSLVASGHKWTTTPVIGRIYGSGANTIFLPAAGEASSYHRYKLNYVGKQGYYWSCMAHTYPSERAALRLFFADGSGGLQTSGKPKFSDGLSVRCVEE
jgi:uncharacterized protein (TIGR02145 family)